MKSPPLILIVDDNPTNLDILQARLAAHNYQIITAMTGKPVWLRSESGNRT